MMYPYTLNHITTELGDRWIAESEIKPGCYGMGKTPYEAIRSLEHSEKTYCVR